MAKAKKQTTKKNLKKTALKPPVGASGNFALNKKAKSAKSAKKTTPSLKLKAKNKPAGKAKKPSASVKVSTDKKARGKKPNLKNKIKDKKFTAEGKKEAKTPSWIHFSKETKQAIAKNSADILNASISEDIVYPRENFKKTEESESNTEGIFSKEIFGSPKVGSPYFNTLRRGVEFKRILGDENIESEPEVKSADKMNGDKAFFKENLSEAVKEKKVEINFDLSNFSKSPHAVDLRDKNTHEIKQIIKGGKSTAPELVLGGKKPKIKKNEVGPNFLKEEMVLMSLQSKEKIGFFKTLFIPFYTVFNWAESFFIDLSDLAKGRLPRLFKFSLPLRWKSSLAAFIALCFVIILPFEIFFIHDASSYKKGKVLGEAVYALEELKTGGRFLIENNLDAANNHFSISLDKFKEAKKELDSLNSLVIKIAEETSLDGGKISTGKNLVAFGESISRAAVYLNGALINILGEDENSEPAQPLIINENVLEGVNLPSNLLDKIEILGKDVNLASGELKAAKLSLDNINFNVLTEEEQAKLLKVKEFLPSLIASLDEFSGFLDVWSQILGKENFKRYLIIFQNNYEIRATGGFIGSFALIDVDKGKIKNVEIPGGGSYDLQGGLLERIGAPEPLYLVSPLWQFHDANWWPDYPTSAEKIMQFYESSGGRTVDGVISITPEMIINLLKITGPIPMEEYKEVIDDKNFMWATQYNVELEYDKEENKPKKIIADLCVKLLDKLTEEAIIGNNEGLGELFNILGSAVKKKDLQLYFADESFQNFVEKYSIAGNIKDFNGDYLMVVNTNIGGGKSDSVISQNIDLISNIQEDGSIINKLVVKRTHNGNKDDFFQRVRNVNWMRIYVPEGSELVSAKGFRRVEGKYFTEPIGNLETDADIAKLEGGFKYEPESGTRIYNQFNKTVFANWSMIDLGETAEIEIEYKLPFKIIEKKQPKETSIIGKLLSLKNGKEESRDLRGHTIMIQKQAGIDSGFGYELSAPENWKLLWNNSAIDNFQGNLDADSIFGKIFEIENGPTGGSGGEKNGSF